MSLCFVFHPLAAIEFDEAVDYYEALQQGKGLEFADAVETAIEHIRNFPEASPATAGAVRSKLVMPSSRWHHTVHHRVTGSTVRILALAHQKQQPFYWFDRQ